MRSPSPRQLRCLLLVARGATVKQAAAELGASVSRVKDGLNVALRLGAIAGRWQWEPGTPPTERARALTPGEIGSAEAWLNEIETREAL